MLTDSQTQLIETARGAAYLAYAPYSKFRVGAAVVAEDGQVFTGANIENASSNLGICAERVALARAHLNRVDVIVGIAVACIDASATRVSSLPCGACRQWIHELAPNAWIVADGIDTALALDELLPRPFSLPHE